MSRYRSLLIALVLVSAAGCLTGRAATLDPGVVVPVERFRPDSAAFTTYSGLLDSLRLVIRDDAKWRDYWLRIHSPFIPAPPVPPVDFGREMVVLASLGARPTEGYDIIIQSAERDSAGIRVTLRRSNPGRGCMLASSVTHPVDLAKLEASDLPVRFDERITAAPCGAR